MVGVRARRGSFDTGSFENSPHDRASVSALHEGSIPIGASSYSYSDISTGAPPESLDYPRPESLLEPLAVPTVGRAVRPELLLRQFSPRSSGVHHPQYCAEHLSVASRLGRPCPGSCTGNSSLTRSNSASVRRAPSS